MTRAFLGSRSLSSQIQARSGVQEHIQFGERGYLFELKTTELPDGDNQAHWDGSCTITEQIRWNCSALH